MENLLEAQVKMIDILEKIAAVLEENKKQ